MAWRTSRSGSFHNRAKKVLEKPWFLLFCDFFMTFFLWRLMYLQNVKAKKHFVDVLKATDEKSRILIWIGIRNSVTWIINFCSPGAVSRRQKSIWIHADPDPQHWGVGGGGGGNKTENADLARILLFNLITKDFFNIIIIQDSKIRMWTSLQILLSFL